MWTAHLQSLYHHAQLESPSVSMGFGHTEVVLSVIPSYSHLCPLLHPSVLAPAGGPEMQGWNVLGVSTALSGKATWCVVSKSRITHSPLLVVRLMLSSQVSCGLCLPEEQRRMAGTLEDAKGRNLLPALGSAEVTGFVGRGRRLPLLRALISFLSTSLLSLVLCRPQ